MYVIGYPKSGNTWLCFLLAYCLNTEYDDVDAPGVHPTNEYQRCYVKGGLKHDSYRSQIGQVLKTHSIKNLPSSEPTVYLIRDGRDVMVSYYFFRRNYLKRSQIHTPPLWKKWLRKVRGLFGGSRPDAASQDFSTFLRHHTLEWLDHVSTWLARNPTAVVRYEDLKRNPQATLIQLFDRLEVAVNPEVIQQALDIFDFKQLSQRKAGEEDSSSFFRKGIVGDWENHFTAEDLKFFQSQATETMRQVGYDI